MTLETLPDSLWCPRGHGLIRARLADCPVCGLPLLRLVEGRSGTQQWAWAAPPKTRAKTAAPQPAVPSGIARAAPFS